MSATLRRYPAYKDSGVRWLGQVPERWQVQRMKTLLRERSTKGYPNESLLAATQTKGVVRKEQYENRTVVAMKDLHLLKLVRVGDFVISLRSFQGGIEYAREQGIISPAYTILYSVDPHNHGFLAWLFKSNPYVQNLSLFVTGIRQGQNIDYERLSRSELPLPPKAEQAAIIRFLDHADRRIRRYIRAKQKLIGLLEEQKQAIIHRTVTRGLDPNVRLKSSGVEWIGDVPEYWKVRRISWLFNERNERGSSGLPVLVVSLRTGVTVGAEFNGDGRPRRLIEDVTSYKYAEQGDIAYNMMRMWQGAVGVVPVPGLVSPAYVVARPRDGVLSSYFELLFRTADCKNEINRNSRGIVSDRNRLYWDDFKRLYVLLPPPEEQRSIIDHVERETIAIATVIDRAHREISLLREYRTRLIADVVTGKQDVREAAAKLPDEANEPEALDDGDAMDDGDGTADDLDAVPEEVEA